MTQDTGFLLVLVQQYAYFPLLIIDDVVHCDPVVLNLRDLQIIECAISSARNH